MQEYQNRHDNRPEYAVIEDLMAHIRQRFYSHCGDPKAFFRDRRALLYAITWPASWLGHRALQMPPERYRQLIRQRLHDIATHGDPKRYHPYFPAYLLKCIQDWFKHHGEDLYDELKHIRNALFGIETLLQQLHNDGRPQRDTQQQIIETMARTHHILHQRQNARKKTPQYGKQLELF